MVDKKGLLFTSGLAVLFFLSVYLIGCQKAKQYEIGDTVCIGTDLFYYDGRDWEITEESSVYCGGENPEKRTHFVIGGHCV